MLQRCLSTNLMHIKFELPVPPTNTQSCSRQLDLINDIYQQFLVTFYPVLPSLKENSEKFIVHLGSKMLISSNRASKHVGFSVIQRELCQWMEAVPPIPCHQPAFCPMLLSLFPRKLLRAILDVPDSYIVSRTFQKQGFKRSLAVIFFCSWDLI